ncbi:hypothetical protein IDVR_26240 [Intrasporangium sp. DVR]
MSPLGSTRSSAAALNRPQSLTSFRPGPERPDRASAPDDVLAVLLLGIAVLPSGPAFSGTAEACDTATTDTSRPTAAVDSDRRARGGVDDAICRGGQASAGGRVSRVSRVSPVGDAPARHRRPC